MAKLLMCRPEYYAIEYEINPWMSRLRPADRPKAMEQWERLYWTLVGPLEIEVELLQPAPGLPDLVFAANAGLVVGDTFVRSNFRYEQRAREEPFWEAWFSQQGYRIVTLPGDHYFEGEGDAFVIGGRIFAGWRYRSDRPSHDELARALEMPVVSLELADPYFYHLDTCFCPIGPDHVMYYPAAFTPESARLIEESFAYRIAVSPDEARRFVCNAIVAGESVVTSKDCPQAQEALAAWGYDLVPVDTSEFIKAGGSAKCMVLYLEREVSAPRDGDLSPAGALGRSDERHTRE